MSKYSTKIDLQNPNSSHTKILKLVGKDKKVVEFGCSSGFMSEILKNEFGCEVVGIELDPDDAKEAKAFCKEVIVGDIEKFEWCDRLPAGFFDVAIFADVLEHLKDPAAVLQRVKPFLKEEGYVLVSVPNIANIAIRLELLLGSLEPEELGILDRTHLRNFTRKSLIQMIEGADFYIDWVDYVEKGLPNSVIQERLQTLDLRATEKTIEVFNSVDFTAFQFIVRGMKKKPASYNPFILPEVEKPERAAEALFQQYRRELDRALQQLKQADEWLREKDGLILGQNRQIQDKEWLLQEQSWQIREKDQLLEKIRQPRVLQIAKFFRRLIYIKLLGKRPLLRKIALTLQQEGFGGLRRKTKAKLLKIYKERFRGAAKGKFLVKIKNVENRTEDIDPLMHPYDAYVQNNEIRPNIRKIISDATSHFQYQPLISILMPVFNVEPKWLQAAVDSVKNQIYPNWELCLADDASTNQATRHLLESYRGDQKIKIVFRKENGHICAASNSAADLAGGEFVVFMDNDDLLAPNALWEVGRVLQEDRCCDLIYSDEDKIDLHDRRYDPQFKPDWSPELFLSYNYVNHLTCLRRSLFDRVGRFRLGYEGAQDYDLLLRATEKTQKIHHIPKILYHWRAIAGSTALEARDKPIMHISARRGLQEHLQRKNIGAEVYQPDFAKRMGLPIYQLDWPDQGPSVAVLIPTFNQGKLLKECVGSIKHRTTYRNYEILIIDNDSCEEETICYLQRLAHEGVRVERIRNEGRPFSFSRINNLAAQKVNTEYLLFLNNDIVVSEPKWLSRLVGYLSLAGVGAVGARLLHPNKTIQHAGVVLGMHGGMIPDHAFINQTADLISYYFLGEVARNCSSVTGACLMTRRSTFLEADGFNEQDFKVSLQDVDYCLRLSGKGLRTVYVAGAELVHHQSMSRQKEDDPRELAQLRKKYILNQDPFYNPNLSKMNSFAPDTTCALADYHALLDRPLKVLIFTHNLELAGAPKAMLDLAKGLKTGDKKIIPVIISPVTGPFQPAFEKEGIAVRIVDLHLENLAMGWNTKMEYDEAIKNVQNLLAAEKPDVLITNTLYGFYVLKAARPDGTPCIWIISESFTNAELHRYLNDFTLNDCLAGFKQAYRVIFGSWGTRNYYEPFNAKFNFEVIHNSIEHQAINQFMAGTSKAEARAKLQIPLVPKILLMVGTICERKGQETLAAAVAYLKKRRNDFACYLVGANENIAGQYLQRIFKIIEKNDLQDALKVIPEVKELYWYYKASDIFAFTSHTECYPLATLEAMAFGLPIVTTPCCGVTEQVRSVNALFFEPGDHRTLANQLDVLLNDETQRLWMGRNSKAISEYQQTYPEMIERYKDVIFGGWIRGNKN